jgi:hypothetical protein
VTGKKEKAQLQHTVQHPAMKRSRLLWVTPKLTTSTGVTMRELRFRRYVCARFRGLSVNGPAWLAFARRCAELEHERKSDLSPEEIGALLQRALVAGELPLPTVWGE